LAHLCWSQRPAEVFHQACIVHRQLGHSPFLPAIGSPAILERFQDNAHPERRRDLGQRIQRRIDVTCRE
jgi:hypothetical protein